MSNIKNDCASSLSHTREMRELDNNVLAIAKLIDTHRENAFRKVNEELVMMYYEIGSYLSNKITNEKWG